MKTIWYFFWLCIGLFFSCSDSPESVIRDEPVQKIENIDAAQDDSQSVWDEKMKAALLKMKNATDLFRGSFNVYNSDGKKLKKIEIDSLGIITGSNIYKMIRIIPDNDYNAILLFKGTKEESDSKDTFIYEESNGKIVLYKAETDSGKLVQMQELYRFKKIQ